MKTTSSLSALNRNIFENAYSDIDVQGHETIGGTEVIYLNWRGHSAWLKRQDSIRPAADILRILSGQGLHLIGKDGTEILNTKLPMVTHFPQSDLIDRVGRNGGYFGLPDGTVITPAAEAALGVRATYRTNQTALKQEGTLKGWRAEVASVVVGHELPMFAAFLPLAAALMEMLGDPEPICIQIVASTGSGLSDLPKIIGSVQGTVAQPPLSFDAFMDSPFEAFDAHRGMVLMLEDPNLSLAAHATGRQQAVVLAFLRSWASRRAEPKIVLITGERSLVEWAGSESDVGQIAAQEVIVLRVDDNRPCGIYSEVDEQGIVGISRSLSNAVREFYGKPYFRFIQRMVKTCAKSEVDFRRKVDRYRQDFIDHSKVSGNQLAAMRVANAFGYVYAAAKLAKDWSILPGDWKHGVAVSKCYRRLYRPPIPGRPIADILNDIASASSTVRLDAKPRPSKQQITDASAYVRGKGQRRKLFINLKDGICQYPELYRRLYDHDTREMLIAPDPVSSKQRLTKNDLRRVYAFFAPEINDVSTSDLSSEPDD